MASLNMVSLELLMWRPTPQKPDIAGNSSDPENTTDFTNTESFKAMFHFDPNRNGFGEPLQRVAGNDCAFEARLSYLKPNGRDLKNKSAGKLELKSAIKTSAMTDAALSMKLTLWRPTPQKPDSKGGIVAKSYEGYFLFGPAHEPYQYDVHLDSQNDEAVAQLIQRNDESDVDRTLDLTITVPLAAEAD
jgi:hypothetical protein